MSATTAGVHTRSANRNGIAAATGSNAPQVPQPAEKKEHRSGKAGNTESPKSPSCFGRLFGCLRPVQQKPAQDPRPSQKVSSTGPAATSNAARESSRHPKDVPKLERLSETPRTKDEPVKTLLLGSSESGKSTLLKSFKLHLEGPYTEAERKSFREILWSDALMCMRIVLEGMEVLEIPLGSLSSEYHVQTVFMQPQNLVEPTFPDDLRTGMVSLLADSGFQACMARSSEYQQYSGATYYFANLERIGQSDYIPTDEDILMSRVKTVGLPSQTYVYDGYKYNVIDFGGVRSERKKWIWGFSNAEVVIFAVDASNYDQLLFEDETQNRMQEQLLLFDSIVNSRWFLMTSVFLVFTKMDRFREKLKTSPLEKFFPEYTAGSNFEQARDYLANQFLSLSIVENRTVPTYFLDNVSTASFGAMFSSIHDHVIQNRGETNSARA